MPRMKKIRLPPTNQKGVETYLRHRGYRINPVLEGKNMGRALTFEKPLPDGRRLHGHVTKTDQRFYIKQHIDKIDPHRNPLGHLMRDVQESRKDYGIGVVRRRTSKRK